MIKALDLILGVVFIVVSAFMFFSILILGLSVYIIGDIVLHFLGGA